MQYVVHGCSANVITVMSVWVVLCCVMPKNTGVVLHCPTFPKTLCCPLADYHHTVHAVCGAIGYHPSVHYRGRQAHACTVSDHFYMGCGVGSIN